MGTKITKNGIVQIYQPLRLEKPRNFRLVLNGLDLGFEHVTMARIYLTCFKEDYPAMNETYRQYFALDRLPARTCVGVTGLAYDALIEIDLICRRPS
jgi:2-iminobutanoate/2-iminopropanoate deaminase